MNMRSEWSYISASREDEDMPLIRGILGGWSATHIIREGTGWEHRWMRFSGKIQGDSED